MFDYAPGSRQAVTGLHFSPLRGAGPLTCNVMFHKNSFLLKGSKIIKLNLIIVGRSDLFVLL
jgi:hypothetical protein